MNNFNTSWMFNPPNLFGTRRMPNGNCCPNTFQPVPNLDTATDTAESEKSQRTNTEESREYGNHCCEPDPTEPRGEPGEREPACSAEYPQNSIFATFSDQELILPERDNLPLKVDIPDITGNISLCNSYSVMLNPGYYAIYYYISAVMKKHDFIKLTPAFNNCMQTAYRGYAEATKRRETLEISRYFIAEILNTSPLFFTWYSSASATKVNMNISIEKLCRQL